MPFPNFTEHIAAGSCVADPSIPDVNGKRRWGQTIRKRLAGAGTAMAWLDRLLPPRYAVSFNDGALVRNQSRRRPIVARFLLRGRTEYEVRLEPNHWGKSCMKFAAPWEIHILTPAGRPIASHHFDPRGRSVLVVIDSRSLGDTLAWIPQVERYARAHPDTKVFCSHFWPDLCFESTHPILNFVKPDQQVEDLYATYRIGYYLDDERRHRHPQDPRRIPLPQIASDILGLDYAEVRPRLGIANAERPFPGRYVCLSTASTAACKHWLYPGGWQRVVDRLHELGCQPVLIQKEPGTLERVLDRSGDAPIQERITWLLHCEFFVGLGSGLSWLAWALGRPVVMIAGFSEPYTEFQQDCDRVLNRNVCHGCWNDPAHSFVRGDWNWCPRHRDTERQFECSRAIAPRAVEAVIERVLTQDDVGSSVAGLSTTHCLAAPGTVPAGPRHRAFDSVRPRLSHPELCYPP